MYTTENRTNLGYYNVGSINTYIWVQITHGVTFRNVTPLKYFYWMSILIYTPSD